MIKKFIYAISTIVIIPFTAFADLPLTVEDLLTSENRYSNITTFSDYSEMALLSDQEMISTEGEWLPIVIRFGPIAAKLAYHGAHHTFRWIGRSPHLQLNWWRPGVSGSDGAFRIPWQWWTPPERLH